MHLDVISSPQAMRYCILLPVFNDWMCLSRLLERLDAELHAPGLVMIVNDGGSELPDPPPWAGLTFLNIRAICVHDQVRNLGNQRTISLALGLLADHVRCDAVIIMDADGEDRPEELPRLLEASRQHPACIVVAQRAKRSESLAFRICYFFYQKLFQILTGNPVSFGNYSIVPAARLPALARMPELAVNFPAGLIRSKLPIAKVSTVRGRRYDGRSSQNFANLIAHGINGIVVFADTAFIRLALVILILIAAASGAFVGVVGIRLFTDWPIPGWATNVTGFLAMFVMQSVFTLMIGALILFSSRNTFAHTPYERYRSYLGPVRRFRFAGDSAEAWLKGDLCHDVDPPETARGR